METAGGARRLALGAHPAQARLTSNGLCAAARTRLVARQR